MNSGKCPHTGVPDILRCLPFTNKEHSRRLCWSDTLTSTQTSDIFCICCMLEMSSAHSWWILQIISCCSLIWAHSDSIQSLWYEGWQEKLRRNSAVTESDLCVHSPIRFQEIIWSSVNVWKQLEWLWYFWPLRYTSRYTLLIWCNPYHWVYVAITSTSLERPNYLMSWQ